VSLSDLTTPHPSMAEQKYLETINTESTRRVDVDEKNSQRLRDLSENMVLSCLVFVLPSRSFCAVLSCLVLSGVRFSFVVWSKAHLVLSRLVVSSRLVSLSRLVSSSLLFSTTLTLSILHPNLNPNLALHIHTQTICLVFSTPLSPTKPRPRPRPILFSCLIPF
jgi:hypothetical protein